MYQKALELTPGDYEIWGAVGDCYRAMEGGGCRGKPLLPTGHRAR